MDKIVIRKALENELDIIYQMGFDAWSDGSTLENYLEDCRASVKYRQGQWLVLEKNEELISSLLIHSFGNNVFGIGSIATAHMHRKYGHASRLITFTLESLVRDKNAKAIYLYSDINRDFYHTFGFVTLPKESQKYSTSTCMVYMPKGCEVDLEQLNSPKYF